MSGKTSRKGNKKKGRRTKKQFYKMKGCSKKQSGGYIKQGNLAYPSSNVPVVRNPSLAYTGGSPPVNYKNAYPNQSNVIDVPYEKQYVSWLNNQTSNAHGGGCGSCAASPSPLIQSGGNNGLPYGGGLPPMKGIPYAGGTAGEPLITGNISTWPGVRPVGGNGNHYPLNTYKNSFTTNPINESPTFNLKGGKRRNKRNRTSKNIKGGGYNFSNSIMQDFVNLGRQFTHGLGSTYNALNGYSNSPNPLPWKDQLYGTPSYQALKLFKY
jgi:hypothetical protein